MSSIEEDAFARAQQMHSRVPYYSNNSQNRSQKRDVHEESEKKPPENPQKATISGQKHNDNENDKNVLDTLFKNKEQSLILLLTILLMEEKADSTLLLALMYLLI